MKQKRTKTYISRDTASVICSVSHSIYSHRDDILLFVHFCPPKMFFSSLFYFIRNFTNFTLHLKSSHVPCFFFVLFTCFNLPTCSRITFWLFFFLSKTSRSVPACLFHRVTLSGRPFGFLFPAQFSLTSNCSHSTVN